MKVPEQYGGLGLSQVYYNRALTLVGLGALRRCGALLSAHQSIGVAEPLLHFGSEEQKQRVAAQGRQRPHLRVPADRARRRLRPRARRDDRDADRGRQGLHADGRKLWATNGAIADIVVVMAKVPKSDGHRGGISAFVLPYDTEGVKVDAPQRVHGPARDRELGHRARGRPRPEGEPDRQGGPGPQDRADHAEHRPPGAAGDLRSASTKLATKYRARVRRASACSGASRSASTTRSRRRSRSSPRRRSAWRRCSTCARGWPTTSSATSASRPRSASCTARRSAGRSSTS